MTRVGLARDTNVEADLSALASAQRRVQSAVSTYLVERGRQKAFGAKLAAWMSNNVAHGRPPTVGAALDPALDKVPGPVMRDPIPRFVDQALSQARKTILVSASRFGLSPLAVLANPQVLLTAVGKQGAVLLPSLEEAVAAARAQGPVQVAGRAGGGGPGSATDVVGLGQLFGGGGQTDLELPAEQAPPPTGGPVTRGRGKRAAAQPAEGGADPRGGGAGPGPRSKRAAAARHCYSVNDP